MPETKHIVIKREELHPRVKDWVSNVLTARRNRLYEDSAGGYVPTIPISMGFGSIAGFMIGPLLSGVEHIGKGVAYGALTGAFVGSALPYKFGSRDVRDSTIGIGGEIKEKGVIDAAGRFKVVEVRKTHPFAFVNCKGDLVLVPNTRFQRALAKSQQTFLKHIVPGRYRVHL